MFLAAAAELASQTDEASLTSGALFPTLSRIRDVSVAIAAAVARAAIDEGVAPPVALTELPGQIRSMMYQPAYQDCDV
jgi:malate dehydrogenase (oxaloacetate-decarboxylating)(NADP+)